MAITRGSSRLTTISRLRAEDARLGRGVGVHRAVPVEVVLGDVEHRGGVGLEAAHAGAAAVELEARQLEHPDLGQVVPRPAPASVSSIVGPMLPAATTLRPARSTSNAVSAVVVVLPLVPVIGEHAAARSRARPSGRPARARTGRARRARRCRPRVPRRAAARCARRAAPGPGSSAPAAAPPSATPAASSTRRTAGTFGAAAPRPAVAASRESHTVTCAPLARAPARHRQADCRRGRARARGGRAGVPCAPTGASGSPGRPGTAAW